jgi:hypothetical protein
MGGAFLSFFVLMAPSGSITGAMTTMAIANENTTKMDASTEADDVAYVPLSMSVLSIVLLSSVVVMKKFCSQ